MSLRLFDLSGRIALWTKSIGHERWFYFYLTACIAVSLVVYAFMRDTKQHSRIENGEETNYITATLGVYLSLYNVFQSLLSLLGIFGGNDD